MKKYLLEMPDEIHAKLKINAIQKKMTMNEVILRSVESEINSKEILSLLKRSYNFIKGGPAPRLEQDLKAYCEFYTNSSKE